MADSLGERGVTPNPTPLVFYGSGIVHSESGVDLSLLRHNLNLTVTERWEQNRQALKAVEAFREAGNARRRSNPPPSPGTSG